MTTRFPRLKRSVPGIGLVRISTRATSKRQHERRVALFDELLDADQIETIRLSVPGTKSDASAAVVSVDPQHWHWIDAAVPSPVRYKWLRLHWMRGCAAAGATGITLHSLRHSLAQWTSDAGVSLSDVMTAMRHAHISTTEEYARRSGRTKVAGVIGGILKRETA